MDFKFIHGMRDRFRIKNVSKELKTLGLAFFIYYLAWGIINPFLSIYFYQVTNNYAFTGLLKGSVSLFSLLISLPVGDLLDKINRKKLLILSFLNYWVVGPLYWFAGSFYTLLIARFYNAFSSTGVWTGGMTLARSYSEEGKESEGMGFFSFSSTVSRVIGPLIAIILLSYFTIKDLFLILPITATAALLLIQRNIPDSEREEGIKDGLREVVEEDKVFLKEIKDYLSDKRNLTVSTVYFLTAFNFSLIVMVLALFAREIGAQLWQVGLIYFVFYIPFLLRLEFGYMADRYGRRKVISIGAIFSALFFVLMFNINSLWVMFFFTLLISIGGVMIRPSLEGMVTKLGKGKEGEITGIYRSIWSLGAAIGPLIAGIISEAYTLNHAFLVPAFFSLLIPVILLLDHNH